MNTYSASRINLYLTCRAQYYDKYILRKKETRKDTAGLFGSALHSAIEERYKSGADPYLRFQRYVNVMYSWYTRKGYDISHSVELSDMMRRGKDILDTFPWQEYNPLHLEYDFTVPLIHPHTGRHVCDIHGYIDLIDASGFIVDFKSAKRKPTVKALNEDIQFTLYAYAAEHLWGELPVIRRHHLRDHSVMAVIPDKARQDIKIDEICSIVEAMELDEFQNVRDGQKLCDRCAPWCGRR